MSRIWGDVQHIDEHTIELYVLGSLDSRATGEVEVHLNACEGCRRMAERIGTFYKEAQSAYDELPAPAEATERSLARVKRDIAPYWETISAPVPSPAQSRVQQFRSLIVGHRVVAGATGLGLAGGVVLGFLSLFTDAFKDTTPAFHNYEPERNLLNVYNKESKLLWNLSIRDARHAMEFELGNRSSLVQTADLYGDGRKEVITSLLLMEDEAESYPQFLRIFDGNKHLLLKKRLDRPFRYLDRTYEQTFSPGAILVGDYGGNGTSEMLVTATAYRSPFRLVRLDANGEEIGAYWHFGRLPNIYSIEVPGSDSTDVLLTGENDTRDSVKEEFGVIVVLDPRKIAAQAQASATPGFGMPNSSAEVYYIRLPRTDMDEALGTHGSASNLVYTDSESIGIVYAMDPGKEFGYGLEYFFDRSFHPISVKNISRTEQVHTALRQQGRVHSTFDAAYLERLKQQIRYWDGKEWRKEVVRVLH